MRGNSHVRCGVGEKAETASKPYLSPQIPLSKARQKAFISEQIEAINRGIQELKNKKGERFSIKAMEKSRKNLRTKLEKLNDSEKKDRVVTFEELGVDRLFVDESHYFKNRAKRCA